MSPADRFPSTHRTWIDERLARGDDDSRAEINRHVMEVYSLPLEVYFRGTTDRQFHEVEDVIHGFLADRLARADFFRDWSASGLRLRRWLMNAFGFYLKELRKKAVKRRREADLPEELPGEGAALDVEIDRAFARSLIRSALERTERICREKNLEEHWRLFHAHYYRERPYREICDEVGIDPVRAATMVRTVTGKFRRSLRDILARDGATSEELNGEIVELLELTRG